MLHQFSIKRIAGFFFTDWLGTLAMLVCASYLRAFLGNLPPSLVNRLQSLHISVGLQGGTYGDNTISMLPIFIVVAVIWPIFFVIFSVYDGRHNETLEAELRNILIAVCVSMVALAGILFLTYRETSRVLILIFFLLDLIFLLSTRLIFYAYRRIQKDQGNDRQRKVVIIGAGEVGCNAAAQLIKYSQARLNLIGYLDDDPRKQGREFAELPVLGTLDQVSEVVAGHSVQDAVLALPLRAHERLVQICTELQKLTVRVYVIPDLFVLSFPNATLDGFGGIPVIDLGYPGLHGKKRFVKRVFDILTTSVILIIISPLLFWIAILIKLDSPGPLIYRQKRIGENGRPFSMYKFRSMCMDADPAIHQAYVTRLIRQNLKPEQLGENNGNSLKMVNDPRVTRVGRFLRKTSLDELPQLINVLRGEMSLVGPRPDVPYAVDLYQEWHRRRFECLPGMTGWWQVKGRNRVSYDEMIRMDIYYIEHMSFWMDIKILLLTPWEVISGRGAG